MERNKIEQFMLLNFNESDIQKIQSKLESVPEESATLVLGTEFKKPTTSLIISFLGGGLGIDRFYLGQTGKGILKLITCGGFGIWAIIDLFIIMGATKEYNTNKLISIINRVVPKKSVQSPVQPSVQSYQPATEQPVAEIQETNVENNETNSAD